MNIMVLTDNEFIYKNFNSIIRNKQFEKYKFDFYYSPLNLAFESKYNNESFKAILIKEQIDIIINKYDLIFSLHCKQIFPEKLVKSIRCINVHPGFNPFNRGYYPQVFSLINKLPVGVTIHEMDEFLDHGPIIIQEEIKIETWDTSFDVYTKIQNKEIELINKQLKNLIEHNYRTTYAAQEGNINLKKEFDDLCIIELNKLVTYREAIDYFRAMTFNGYDNAYFIDENGSKIFVQIRLSKDNKSK